MSAITRAAAQALAARDEAKARFEREMRSALVGIAQERLTDLFGGAVDVAAELSVEQTDLDALVVILSDGDVHLAVSDDGDVRLTEQVEGQWTDLARPVVDLADLGAALAERKA